jgi:hypothetical protein
VDESALPGIYADVEAILEHRIEADLQAKPEVTVSGFIIPESVTCAKEVVRLADRRLSSRNKSTHFSILAPSTDRGKHEEGLDNHLS